MAGRADMTVDVLVGGARVSATNPLPTSGASDASALGDPVGFQQLAVSSGAVALTVPATAQGAVMTVETASVRLRTDGTAPTASVGLLFSAATVLTLTGRATLLAARLIRATSTDASVAVAYFN